MNLIKPLTAGIIILFLSFQASLTPVINKLAQTQSGQPRQQLTYSVEKQDISRNWSGYTATNGTFTGVSSTWTVPKINGSTTYGADAAWIGIGGVDTPDLIQAGTQGIVDMDGQVIYQAFFETLPYPSEPLGIDVNAGDSVTIAITQKTPGNWQIAFKDNTTNKSIHFTKTYDSSLSSADWIEEAPSGVRRVMPLDNFGVIHFQNAAAVKDGHTVSLAQTNAKPLAMGDIYGQVLAAASNLGNDGQSFDVARVNATNEQTTVSNRHYYRQYRVQVFNDN